MSDLTVKFKSVVRFGDTLLYPACDRAKCAVKFAKCGKCIKIDDAIYLAQMGLEVIIDHEKYVVTN